MIVIQNKKYIFKTQFENQPYYVNRDIFKRNIQCLFDNSSIHYKLL